MCSNSKGRSDGCGNIVELINGPIGNLVGIGVKALIDRASATTPNSGRNADSIAGRTVPKEQENIEKFYNHIEAHLKGTLRVLKPAIEITNILRGECRSAGHERPGKHSSTRLVYYTPQNRKKCQMNHCRRGDCCDVTVKKERQQQQQRECDRTERSRVSSSSSYSYSAQSTPCRPQTNDSRSKRFQINVSKIDPPRSSSPLRRKLCGVYETEKKSTINETRQTSRSESKSNKLPRCLICNVTLRDNSLLAILPCKHSFCYACLQKSKGPKCQKCNESFDMKNVTQFSTLL